MSVSEQRYGRSVYSICEQACCCRAVVVVLEYFIFYMGAGPEIYIIEIDITSGRWFCLEHIQVE